MSEYQERLRENLRQRYQNKKILVLGFGREGKTSYHFLRRILPDQHLDLMDEKPIDGENDIFKLENNQYDRNITCLSGKDYLQGLNQYDLIFKTPGLPGYHLKDVDRQRITCQTNEFVWAIGKKVVGITGTKGKSTTSSLTYQCLKDLGIDVLLVGNIGRPALELLLEDEPNRFYVYEMSSHQTQFLCFPPRVAVVLNLFEEHLDNYVDYEEYIQSKLNIGRGMFRGVDSLNHLFIYGCDNEKLKSYQSLWQNCRYQSFGHMANNNENVSGIYIRDHEIICQKIIDSKHGKLEQKSLGTSDFPRKLLGEHNLGNSLVALLVVDELIGLNQANMKQAFKTISEFQGLEHRLEKVGTFRGITFYNDSISTIPAAAMAAVHSIDHLQTLIIGGFDRGIDYDGFAKDLNLHQDLRIICLPDTGHKVFPKLNHEYKFLVQNMSEAVAKAYEITEKGYACVLSPAAASYTFYTNFEQRGADYKAKIKEMASN